MALGIDPFAGTDFAQGGSPYEPENPPGGKTPLQPPAPPPIVWPAVNPGADPVELYNQLTQVLNTYMVNNNISAIQADIDPAVSQINKAIAETAKAIATDALARKSSAETEERTFKTNQMIADRQLEAARISAEKALAAAGIGAGATMFSAEEATRRSQLESEARAAEGAATRAGRLEEVGLTNKLAGEREEAQRTFDAQQKGLDREIQRMQLEIAQGNLNLNTALGQLEKWLEAQKFTLPEGAEYVPGFQPGGGVQEASRLAGVQYNPVNYRANTVPFDPAALVRQTMGR